MTKPTTGPNNVLTQSAAYTLPRKRITIARKKISIDLREIGPVFREIVDECRRLDVPDRLLTDMVIVATEAVNNVVEHAYPEGSQAKILVKVSLEDGGLFVRVLDRGRAFPEHSMQKSDFPNVDLALDDLPEGGFGWPLILKLSDSVSFRRKMQSNILEIRFCANNS